MTDQSGGAFEVASPTTPGPQRPVVGEPTGGVELLTDAAGAARNHKPRRRTKIVAAVTAVAALAVVGVGVAAATLLSGGGQQPEDVLPATSVAYVDLDLDPGASQKVSAIRFFRNFPAVDAKLGSGDDLRTALLDSLLPAVLNNRSVDVSTQIVPWLGDRVGAAVVVTDGAAEPVVALQVSDADKAKAQLPTLLGGKAGFAFSGDYVLIARTTAVAAQIASSGQSAPLASSPSFQQQVASLGESVASFYADTDQLRSVKEFGGVALPLGLDQLLSTQTGQVGAILRFQPDAVEIVGTSKTNDSVVVQESPDSLVATLPVTTLAAVGSSGGAQAIREQWSRLEGQLGVMGDAGEIARLEREFNLRLPQDVISLAGTDRVLAVDGSGGSLNAVGYRAITDPSAARDLQARLKPLLNSYGLIMPLTSKVTGDGLVVATSSNYADSLASASGSLGQLPQFQAAVPHAANAQTVVYINVESVAKALQSVIPGASSPALDGFEALGFSASRDGQTSSFDLRLTLK